MASSEVPFSPSPEQQPREQPSAAELEAAMDVPKPANSHPTAIESAPKRLETKSARSKTKKLVSSVEAPKPQETTVSREHGPVAGSEFYRLSEGGSEEKWSVDYVKNDTVFLHRTKAEGGMQYSVLSKADLENEREAMETGKPLEDNWETAISLIPETDQVARDFFAANKAALLEETVVTSKDRANIPLDTALLNVINEEADGHLQSPHSKEDQKLRAGAAMAHALNGLNRMRTGPQIKLTNTERLEVLRGSIGDKKARAALVKHEVELPQNVRFVAALEDPDELKARILQDQKFAYEVLKNPNSSLEAMIETRDLVLEDINLLRLAEYKTLVKDISDLDPVWQAFFNELNEKIAQAKGSQKVEPMIPTEPSPRVAQVMERRRAAAEKSAKKLQSGGGAGDGHEDFHDGKTAVELTTARTEFFPVSVEAVYEPTEKIAVSETETTEQIPKKVKAARKPLPQKTMRPIVRFPDPQSPGVSEAVRQPLKPGLFKTIHEAWTSLWK